MAIFKHQLKNYPELKNWFENEIIHNSNKKSPSYIKHYTNDFQIKVCQSLNLQDKFSYFAWTDALSSLISNSRELEKDFNKCISFFSYYGLDLSLLTSDMAFLSFQLDDARSYLTLIQKIADKTELISFRFLCAWLALNLDDLELCIDECEK
ncbi:MAG: hypothetical protein R3B45_00905 [Bdellovibrionota bacterium]